MVHKYNGILPNLKKNEIMPLAAAWMALEMIILSEISQKEKDTYRLYTKSLKMIQMNLFIKQKQIHRHRKQSYGYPRGKVGE